MRHVSCNLFLVNFRESSSAPVGPCTPSALTSTASCEGSSTSTADVAEPELLRSATDVLQSESAKRLNVRQKRRQTVPTSKKRLTNASFLAQTLALQTRTVQLKREKIQLQRQMVVALQSIAEDVSVMKNVTLMMNNVVVEKATPES
jgi:hypothetical protein